MPRSPSIMQGRSTRQRGAVLRAIEAAGCHVTAEEIHGRLRRDGQRIGLATVYRALETFVRSGLVEPAHIGDGRVRYGLASRHHDHLVCLHCGGWEPLDECLVHQPRRVRSGFRVTGHQLELYGYCSRCQETRG